MEPDPGETKRHTDRQRHQIVARIQSWLEVPMIVLSVVWLALLILDLTRGLSPFLQRLTDAIWILFILQFLVEFTLAPRKLDYLRRSVLTVVSLAVPALRVFRVARVIKVLRMARGVRGVRLVRVVGSLNRGMRTLGRTSRRRGFSYVASLTLIVILGGAAGMYAFERGPAGGPGLTSYGEALWWTAMLVTTIGSEYWPRTAEGRILTLILSFYALGVLSYLAGTLASFFVGQDAEDEEATLASERSLRQLREDIAALRSELAALNRKGVSD